MNALARNLHTAANGALFRSGRVKPAGNLHVAIAGQDNLAALHLGRRRLDDAADADLAVDHACGGGGGNQDIATGVVDAARGLGGSAARPLPHRKGPHAVAGEVDGEGLRPRDDDLAHLARDHAPVFDAWRDKGGQTRLTEGDGPFVDNLRVRRAGAVKTVVARHEISIGDIGGGRQQAADIDDGTGVEDHAVLVDDPDIAVCQKLSADICRQSVQHAVQRDRGRPRLHELDRFIGVDVKALPVDDHALGALTDGRARPLSGNARIAAFDLAALRPGHRRTGRV